MMTQTAMPPQAAYPQLAAAGVEATEMPGLYWVRSRSRYASAGLWHLVDAINETCDCEQWRMRLAKREPGTALTPNVARRCWHLEQVLAAPVMELARLTARVQPTRAVVPETVPVSTAAAPARCEVCGHAASALYRGRWCGLHGIQHECFG